jgi:hypothetical protein
MPYKTGTWGEQAKERSNRRLEYFRRYDRRKSGDGRGKSREYYSIGKKGELEIEKLLTGCRRKRLKEIYDYDWDGKKIDVKTGVFSAKRKGWKFLLYKQKGKVDYFLIVCKDIEEKTIYIFMIPDKQLPKNNLSIPVKGIDKFMKYLFRE